MSIRTTKERVESRLERFWSTFRAGVSQFDWVDTVSILFDGIDEAIACGIGTGNYGNTDPFSISIWFKPATGASGNRDMIGKMNFAGSAGYTILFDTTDAPALYMLGSGGLLFVRTSDAYTKGIWHHAVITYDGSGIANGVQFIVDGTLRTKFIYNNALSGSILNAVQFAMGDNTLTTPYPGNLNEVGVYSKALSTAEAQALYNGGDPINPQSLPTWADNDHYWRMGETASFPIIPDQKGSGDGIMLNMAPSNIVADVP